MFQTQFTLTFTFSDQYKTLVMFDSPLEMVFLLYKNTRLVFLGHLVTASLTPRAIQPQHPYINSELFVHNINLLRKVLYSLERRQEI